jgi:Polyketide cyclase / dehydrase and lipid transport
MASIRKEIVINAHPDDVWAALRDWGAPHRRLVPGFVVDTRLDGRDRVVTFFTGTTVREVLVDLDDDSRRLVWSVVDGPYTHHNASAQVLATDGGSTRFLWIADLLPDEAAGRTAELMDRGIRTVQQTLDSTETGAKSSAGQSP